jgi:hypothetical protein
VVAGVDTVYKISDLSFAKETAFKFVSTFE